MSIKVKIDAPEYDFLLTLTKQFGGNKIPEELTYWFVEMACCILMGDQRTNNTKSGEDALIEMFKLYSEVKDKKNDPFIKGEIFLKIKEFKKRESYKSIIKRSVLVDDVHANIIRGLSRELKLSESKITSMFIEIGKQFNILLSNYIEDINSLDDQVVRMKTIINDGEYYRDIAQTIERWWMAGQNVSNESV